MPEKYSVGSRRQAYLAFSLLASAAILCSATALSSCARKTQADSKPAQAARGAAAVPSAPRPPQAAVAAQAVLPKPTIPLAASLRAYSLGAPSVPRMPMDFSIGPLQSYSPAPGDEAAVLAVARAFLDGIAEGKLDRALLIPEAREALSLLLAPAAPNPAAAAQDQGDASTYRLGLIAIRGEDASLRLRLPSAATAVEVREEGLLSLRKEGDAWYIEALALDPPASGPLAFAPDALDRVK